MKKIKRTKKIRNYSYKNDIKILSGSQRDFDNILEQNKMDQEELEKRVNEIIKIYNELLESQIQYLSSRNESVTETMEELYKKYYDVLNE